jgi:hypothetical protein
MMRTLAALPTHCLPVPKPRPEAPLRPESQPIAPKGLTNAALGRGPVGRDRAGEPSLRLKMVEGTILASKCSQFRNPLFYSISTSALRRERHCGRRHTLRGGGATFYPVPELRGVLTLTFRASVVATSGGPGQSGTKGSLQVPWCSLEQTAKPSTKALSRLSLVVQFRGGHPQLPIVELKRGT